MWFERKKLARFVMVLAMAVSAVSTAWAALKVEPLYFENIQGEQQDYWNYLMRFKLWGSTGISIGQRFKIEDQSGWTGTSNGDLITVGEQRVLGGPIIVGGNITLDNKWTHFTSGPIRASGDFEVFNNENNSFSGSICVNSANDIAKQGITRGGGVLYEGNPTTEACAESKVAVVRSDLTVPSLAGSHSYNRESLDIGVERTGYIDVPKGKNADDVYDIYMESLQLATQSTLIIRMPYGGRLTRIFVNDLNQNYDKRFHYVTIKIEYVDKDAVYDEGANQYTTTGTVTTVTKDQYSGNLLFYFPNDLAIKEDQYEMLGTFISKGTISVENQIKFAGQLIANNLNIGDQVDGSGFRYVPFSPEKIGLRTVDGSSKSEFPENDIPVKVDIVLDNPATVDVSFSYCFEFAPDWWAGSDVARAEDFNNVLPLCEFVKASDGVTDSIIVTTSSGKVFIPLGYDKAQEDIYDIIINAKKDKIPEDPRESFRLHLFNAEGAVFEDSDDEPSYQRTYTLWVVDSDRKPKSNSDSSFVAKEDIPYAIGSDRFYFESETQTQKGIIVVGLPVKGHLVYKNSVLEKTTFATEYPEGLLVDMSSLDKNELKFVSEENDYSSKAGDESLELYSSFKFKVIDAADVVSEDAYDMMVYVAPVNDPPDAHDTTFNFMENLDTKAGAVPSDVKIRIEDVDDESYTFAWSEKYDDSYTKAVLDRVKELYDLDPNTGVISAKQDAALDYESGDSVLVAKIVVSDKNGGTGDDDQIKRDIIVATIKINDVNEDPVVKPGQTFTISEFAGQDPSIPVEVVANDGRDASEPQNKVLASDVDLNKNPPKGWGYLTYTIEENPNFAIDPVTGVISVKEGADIDFEDDTKNSFTLTVTVTDGGGKSASAEVTITVSNENETPKFVDDGTDNYIALEHSKPDTVVKRWAIDDPDADDDASNLNVSLEDVHSANSVLATDVFDVRIVEESGSMFVELFVSDSAKLDFESIYEALSGDTTFAVKITLSDDEGGSSSLEKKIKVHDVNELHVAQPLNPTIDENPRKNAVVDTVKVLDPDTKNPDFRKYEYSIVEKDVPFAMSDSLIVVADSSKLDYETVPGHKFEIHVAIVDKNDPTLADTAVVVITLKDVDESPKIIPDSNDDKCDDMVTNCTKPKDPIPEDCADGHCGNVDKDNNVVAGIRENSATGTVVMEYYVVDEDGDDDDLTKLKVELKDNNKTGVDSLFGVKIVPAGADSFKVQVYVKDGSKLDYEAVKNTHNVSIIVTDTTKNGDGFNNPVALSDSIVRIIQVIDVNEPPYVVKKTFEFNEHSAADTVVGKIEWGDDNDLEGVSTEAYRDNKVEIIGGSDGYKDLFSVDSNGVIKTKKEFNYETDDSTYTLIVKVVDKNVPELFVIDTMTIKLLNIPEIPHIVNVTTSVDEHVPPKTPIDTLESRDPDCLDSAKCKYTYELVKDNPYVTVDPDGVIRVADSSKINFEEITKIDIVVRVTDEDGESSDTTITIKINDVNEPPHLKDDVCNVYENAAVNSTVCKLTAKDPDTNPKFNKLEYEQITDNDVFDVLTDGTIKLKKPLDYEKDSVYVIKVRVNDGEFSDTATITINVRDIDEKSNVEITKVIDDDSTYVRPDSVYTNSHVVQLCWHEGRTENKGSTAWGKDICEQDTLTPGRNVITKLYYDETTNYPAVDSVVIFYSNALPTVTISANGDGVSAHNIYTIVEATDKKDTNIYVNKESNDIYITVTDPSKALMGDKDSVKTIQIPTNLKPTTVDQKSYERLNYVMTAGVSVDPVSDPKKNSVSRNVNADSSVTISYVEKVAGVDVVVSYVLDKKGDVVKTPVTHSDGKVTMEEVITVSYTNKDGVTISYMAESGLKSGEVYKMDAQGNLLTSGAAEKLGKTITGNPIAGVYTVSYGQVSANGDSLKVTYSVDGKGKIISSKEGDIGYSVSYTYTDICGNSATEAVYIVLDQQPPRVGIIYPSYGEVIHSNFTNVIWGLIIGQDDATLDASKRFEVDSSWVLDKKHPSIYVRQLKTKRGEVAYDTVLVQDTLSTQGLDKGTNSIVRFYRDKAGNEAADTVYVVMKDGKDVALSVEQPVTIMSKDLVEKYYAKNPLKPGQTYAVSILNPTENKEVETLKGGNFGTKKGSGNEPYPGLDNHLGPTLKLDVRLPVISGKDGLATLDDIMSKDGKVLKYGIDADGEIKGADEDGNVPDTVKIDVDDYVQNHCTDDVIGKYKAGKETSLTLYKSTLSVKIWIYTTLGNFVDYYTFSQDLNDPDLVDEAGMLKMFFELKPDKNGEIRSEDGRVMATGAYLYKVEAKIRSDLLCDLPPLRSAAEEKKGLSSGPKKGEKPIKRSEELLKSFGYKRPANK